MKKNIALLLVISACNLQADMKDTGALYHDTTKNVNQTIHLHNMQAEPAKIITTTKIRRVPKYVYYNVYKTKVVWKCKPKGGGGTPTTPVVISHWTKTKVRSILGGNKLVILSGNALSKGWTTRFPSYRPRTMTVCSPCRTCFKFSMDRGGIARFFDSHKMCGVTVQYQLVQGRGARGAIITIPAGSH
jgi:hypothetical protein